jgi:hypothetical protein
VHFPVPQLSAPHAALPPLQSSVHVAAVQFIVPHAPAPEHVRVHVPTPTKPHVSAPHAALPFMPVHVSVQLPVVQESDPHALTPVHAAVQLWVVHVMLPHALSPVHVISHGLPEHWMPRHALFDVQLMPHFCALEQLIVPHEPGAAHVMSQSQPAGQVMLPLPVPVIEQCIVWKSQVPPQIAGQTGGASGPASIGRVPTMQ